MQIDFYVSHDFPLQLLSPKASTSEVFKTLRAQSESFKYSYSVGARFGFTFPSGMGLKSGLNISKINRSFSFNDSDSPLIEIINGMDTVIGSQGIQQSNSYTYVDIPVIFSYEMAGFGPFYYSFNVGANINMSFGQRGKFFNEDGKIVEFSDNIANRYKAYKTEAGTSLFASFGLHYVWNDLFDFIIEPNVRYAISPITLDEYQLDEKYLIVGLITGLRYKF